MDTILVTGSAGFIGFHLCKSLLEEGLHVVGLDAMTDYYDVELKQARHAMLMKHDRFIPVIGRVEDSSLVMDLFARETPSHVVHLAAQAGVRYSIENPRSYLDSNIIGSFEILEAARAYTPQHLLMASTSSAFGANTAMPYKETDKADHQMSFYAATKKATENMAHSYAHLFDLPVTMFRFFTVYGPWGRPDMALFKFTKAILEGRPIDVYNHGAMQRDFTYIDDLVNGIRLLMEAAPQRGAEPVSTTDSLSPVAPFRVVNIGNSNSVPLTDFIAEIEAATGQRAEQNLMPMQAGDVPATWADASTLTALTGYQPRVSIKEGVEAFVSWYKNYYLP
ncbi:NAD-dependent epimerase/dehydratase family protein [Tritonibacter scottomollicae]|uniref:NAD-dependent epimerase/dehydratase family protein n=1 Tax=Tritonibacter scottomollicae TaxID=483013 RepID=UPI003BAD78BC